MSNVPPDNLKSLSYELYKAFDQSTAIKRGGPGGFEVVVNGQVWHLGMSPGYIFFASNHTPSLERTTRCDYIFGINMTLKKVEQSVDEPAWPWGEWAAPVAVNDVAEVQWLLELIDAANAAEWGQALELRSRPGDVPASNNPPSTA